MYPATGNRQPDGSGDRANLATRRLRQPDKSGNRRLDGAGNQKLDGAGNRMELTIEPEPDGDN